MLSEVSHVWWYLRSFQGEWCCAYPAWCSEPARCCHLNPTTEWLGDAQRCQADAARKLLMKKIRYSLMVNPKLGLASLLVAMKIKRADCSKAGCQILPFRDSNLIFGWICCLIQYFSHLFQWIYSLPTAKSHHFVDFDLHPEMIELRRTSPGAEMLSSRSQVDLGIYRRCCSCKMQDVSQLFMIHILLQ